VNSEIMTAADELRQLIAKADALASVAEDQFGRVIYVPNGADRRGFERVAHLVGLTATAALAALEASNKLVDAVEDALRRAGVQSACWPATRPPCAASVPASSDGQTMRRSITRSTRSISPPTIMPRSCSSARRISCRSHARCTVACSALIGRSSCAIRDGATRWPQAVRRARADLSDALVCDAGGSIAS